MDKDRCEMESKSPAEIEALSSEQDRLDAVKTFREHVDSKYYAMSVEKIAAGGIWMERNKSLVTQGKEEDPSDFDSKERQV